MALPKIDQLVKKVFETVLDHNKPFFERERAVKKLLEDLINESKSS